MQVVWCLVLALNRKASEVEEEEEEEVGEENYKGFKVRPTLGQSHTLIHTRTHTQTHSFTNIKTL